MAGNSKNKKASAAREQRLAGLVALTSDIYWEQDAQYRFTHFSGGPPQMVKSMRRGWLGKRRWDKKFVNMHASDWAAHRKLLEERRPFRDLVLALVEGAPVQWFSVSGEPVFGATGRFLGYRGLGKNITAQKREQALSALEHSVTRALAAAETTAAGIHAVLRAICELEAWPVGRYFVADEAAGVLRFAAAWSSDTAAARAFVAKSQAMVYRPGQGLSGEVWRTGEAIWVADVRKDARAGGSARSAGSRGLRGGALVIPVKIRSATLGVMSFSRGERREPDALLLRSLNAIGEQIGQFLWRKQAETALAQSEIHFRQTFELAASGIAHVSLDGHFLRVNRRLCAILGYGQSQLVGRTVKDISHPEDRDVTDAGRARLHAREVDSTNFEKRYLRQDGSTVWVNLTVALARNTEGEPQYEIAIIEDISERKEAEAKLRRFRAGLDGAADMMFLVDPRDATLLDFNDAVCRILGYSREELLGQPATLVRSDRAAADLVADYRRFRDMPERGETVRIFYRHRNGEMVPVETMRRLIETPEGPIVVINSRDLREQRAAERALRESEERFRSLTKLSTDWYWEQDPEFRFTKFEGGAGDKRYDPSAIVLGKRVWQITRLDLATADWHAHRAALERHEPFRDFEYAYRDEHGNRFYVSASGEPMFDEDGRFKGYRGTARDMTRRRRDEEALRRFRAAMDMSVDAIFLTDRATMRFVDANKAACNVLGVKRADLMDMGPERVFRVPRAEIEQAFDEVIAKGFSGVRVERSYVAADGSERWTELHRRALRADEGWIIVTIARDITERKTAEQRRARHTRRQERIARFGHEALAQRDPHELIAAAVQNVLEALGAEGVAYFEPGSRAGEVVLRALLGTALAAGQGALLQLAAENPLARVLASGKHTCVTGAETGLDWAGALGSVALMPVRGQRGTRAVLAIGQRAHDGFGGEALNFMEAIATILSTALLRIDSESQLAYLAQFDSLTGLPNRALLTDRFGQAIAQAVRRGTTVGVLFVDLDEFKLVNDTLGHAAGDELLKAAAARLQSTVRAGDTVARIAGDEFALLLADLASADQAAIVAQKIVSALGEPFTVRGRDVLVTASVGIAAYPADGQDAEALLAAADAAMYRAKQAGRNSYQFFTPDLNVRMRARSQMTAELRRALERGEFELYYQPKYDLQSRAICGVEALLRWKHPSRGLISPAEFIPLLEESGLIVAVGEWVLGDACAALGARIADGLARHSVAVNLSARQFRQQDLATRLTSIVAAAGVEPGLVELEITESQLMQDPEHAVRVLHALRAAGIGLAIDDFGTGYSSLSYLTRFPLSALKIDRSFVARALDDKAAAAIVRAIIDLARTLGFTVVAEGIETEAQAAFLRGLRCDQGQGFLFARPMPEAELRRLLEASTALAGTKRSGVSQLLGRTRR